MVSWYIWAFTFILQNYIEGNLQYKTYGLNKDENFDSAPLQVSSFSLKGLFLKTFSWPSSRRTECVTAVIVIMDSKYIWFNLINPVIKL